MLAFLELQVQVVPDVLPKQAGAYVRMVEVAKPQLNKGLAAALHAHVLGQHPQTLHAALLDQLRPTQVLAARCEAGRLAHRRREDADLARNRRARCHHDLVLRDHGDGGARDRIDTQHAFIRPGLADLNLVGDRLADVLLVEVQQRRFGDAQQQDGLGMLEHLHAHEAALQVHADQRDDRLARVGRHVGDVGGQHHIAQQFLLAVVRPTRGLGLIFLRALRVLVVFLVLAIGFNIRWLAHAFRKAAGTRKHV